MDAFFAAIEQKRHPELIGKPVVVGGDGDPTKRGVVSTASYEARRFGIYSAMPLRTAYKLCPGAVFLPVDYEEYAKVSNKIKDILREFSPIIEDVGIDEAFLDISGINRSPKEVAIAIKRRIKDETGLTCSIGIGPNRLLAKIASDMEKPDGLTIITEDDIEEKVWPLPVRKLLGIGPKTEADLKGIGINTIGDLASIPLERLIAIFGKSHGSYLYKASRGIDESPLITHWEPRSISREITFQRDTMDIQFLMRNLSELIKDVVDYLRERRYKGRTVTIKLRFSDFKTHTRSKTLKAATDSPDEIKNTALECLQRFDLKKKVRLIGIRLSGLEKTE